MGYPVLFQESTAEMDKTVLCAIFADTFCLSCNSLASGPEIPQAMGDEGKFPGALLEGLPVHTVHESYLKHVKMILVLLCPYDRIEPLSDRHPSEMVSCVLCIRRQPVVHLRHKIVPKAIVHHPVGTVLRPLITGILYEVQKLMFIRDTTKQFSEDRTHCTVIALC